MPNTYNKIIPSHFLSKGTLFHLVLLLSIFQWVNCKQLIATYTMQQLSQDDGWLYIGKMALQPGKLDIKITTERVKTQQNQPNPRNQAADVMIELIQDQLWEIQKQKKCLNSVDEGAFVWHTLIMHGSTSISQHSIEIQKQQLYYIVLKDCEHKFHTDYQNQRLSFSISIQLINNQVYPGKEQDHWLIIPFTIAVGMYLLTADKTFLQMNGQDPDHAKMILFGAIATNISSLMWRSFGFIIYWKWGLNYRFFHFVYLFMHSVSETMVMGLLLLVALGWSLNYLQRDDQGSRKLNFGVPLICFLGFLNIVLSLLTQMYTSKQDMHHTYDSHPGTILISVRLIYVVIFLGTLLHTLTSSRYRVRQFLQKFSVLAIGYLVAMPIIVLIGNRFLPAKKRPQFVFISVEVCKSLCNIGLMYMVSSTKSQFNRLAYRNVGIIDAEARPLNANIPMHNRNAFNMGNIMRNTGIGMF